MSRPFIRSLLSVLILWQLLASVMAHPLHGVPAAADGVSGEAMPDCAEMDAKEMQQMDHMHAHHEQLKGHESGHEHDCQLGCKCPCSGTPALMLALPGIMPNVPEVTHLVNPYFAVHSPAITTPLRPPIA